MAEEILVEKGGEIKLYIYYDKIYSQKYQKVFNQQYAKRPFAKRIKTIFIQYCSNILDDDLKFLTHFENVNDLRQRTNNYYTLFEMSE